jgi:hypothetical protein
MLWESEVAVGTTHGGCRNMVFRRAAVKRRPWMCMHHGFHRRADRYTLRLLAVALVHSGLMQCAVAQSWQALPRAPIRTDRHEDVFFVDAERGWVVNRAGEVHRTTDGGASWQLGFQEPDAFFRSVVFTDSRPCSLSTRCMRRPMGASPSHQCKIFPHPCRPASVVSGP